MAADGPTYSFFDVAPENDTSGGVPGGNIRNAFLYNPDRVMLVGFESLTPDVLTEYGVGDLNSYAQEDSIVTLESGLVNQTPEDQYSYVYFGQAGLLDYAFTTDSLASRITGVNVWHINADEPRVLDYNDEVIDPAGTYRDFSHEYLYHPDAYRSSDHDPVIVGFLPQVEVSVTPDTLWPANHKYVTVNATVDVFDNPNPATLLSVTSNEPDDGLGDGDTPMDIKGVYFSTTVRC